MENKNEFSNEMTLVFDSRPENEGLARVTAAAFCTQLNPTLEEVADLKTAVSGGGDELYYSWISGRGA